MPPHQWRVTGASARGTTHIRGDRPNQDSVAWHRQGGYGTQVIGAVSDGHGAAVHFRSHIGAQLATATAIDLLAWHVDDVEADDHDGSLVRDLVGHWQHAASQHLAAYPLDEVEALLPRLTPLSPYGATLVAFAATRTMLVTLQIGDGDLLIGYADGRIERPLQADAGLVGEETYSLCLPDAVARFRTAARWPGRAVAPPVFIVASTDGVAKSYRDDAGFERAVAQLRDAALSDWAGLSAALPGWLAEVSANGSGDDATMCIALCAPSTDGS